MLLLRIGRRTLGWRWMIWNERSGIASTVKAFSDTWFIRVHSTGFEDTWVVGSNIIYYAMNFPE